MSRHAPIFRSPGAPWAAYIDALHRTEQVIDILGFDIVNAKSDKRHRIRTILQEIVVSKRGSQPLGFRGYSNGCPYGYSLHVKKMWHMKQNLVVCAVNIYRHSSSYGNLQAA